MTSAADRMANLPEHVLAGYEATRSSSILPAATYSLAGHPLGDTLLGCTLPLPLPLPRMPNGYFNARSACTDYRRLDSYSRMLCYGRIGAYH